METVFLDGRFLAAGDARVSCFDAGLQHAVGLFETLLGGVCGSVAWAHRAQAHIGRLVASAQELGLTESLRTAGVHDAAIETIARSGLERARLRITVTGGDLNLLARSSTGPTRPTILIAATPATDYPREMFERGVMVSIASIRTNPLDPMAGHKTLNYWTRLRELQQAAAQGAAEALVFQITNHLAGGCVSNAFIVKNGRLVTPIARAEEGAPGLSIPSPVLPGITRDLIIVRAASRGIETERRMVSFDDVLGADEAFLTNSSWGVLPIVRIERATIGDGAVGAATRLLMNEWKADLLRASSAEE